MDHNNENSSPQQLSKTKQQVVLIQPAHLSEQHSINILDLYLYIVSHIKWFVTILIVMFGLLVAFFIAKNEQRSFQQLIEMPTVVESSAFARMPLVNDDKVINLFYINYVRYWSHVNMPSILNKSFQLGKAKTDNNQVSNKPINYLMLSINAPFKKKKTVQKLFIQSLDAIRLIVKPQVDLWIAGLHQKINNEQQKINYLKKIISSNGENKMAAQRNDMYLEQHTILESQLQSQIAASYKLINNYQWQLSSLQNNVKFSGPLLESIPSSLSLIVVKSFVIALMFAVVVILIFSMLILNIKHMQKAHNN